MYKFSSEKYGCKCCLNKEHGREADNFGKGEVVELLAYKLTRHEERNNHKHNLKQFIKNECCGREEYLKEQVPSGIRDSNGRVVIGSVPRLLIQSQISANNTIQFTPQTIIRMKIFRIALMICQKELPFEIFDDIIKTYSLNGFDLGKVHHSRNSLMEIINSIATFCKKKQIDKILQAKAFSIMFDDSEEGRNDCEDVCIVVSYIDPETNLVAVEFFELKKIDIKNSVNGFSHDSKAVFSAIVDALNQIGENYSFFEMLVGGSCDGAAVNTGDRNGVNTKILAKSPWYYSVHCFAHRLELALHDAFKKNENLGISNQNEDENNSNDDDDADEIDDLEFSDDLQNLIKILKMVFRLFGTAKQWQNLLNAAKKYDSASEMNVNKFVSLHGIRWAASIFRSIKALYKNAVAIIAYCDQHLRTYGKKPNELNLCSHPQAFIGIQIKKKFDGKDYIGKIVSVSDKNSKIVATQNAENDSNETENEEKENDEVNLIFNY